NELQPCPIPPSGALMSANRIVGPVLAVILFAGVGYGIYRSASDAKSRRGEVGGGAPVTLHGLVGSEKVDYLTDQRVVQALAEGGITLRMDKSGSRERAARPDLKEYDFAFPAGVPAATKILQVSGAKRSYTPFFTPMAVASWLPIASVLEANG